MNLTFDINTRKVSGDAQSLSRDVVGALKLGRTESISIGLLNNGSSFTLGVGDSLIFSLKSIGQYEGSLLQEVTLTSADLADGRYTKEFSTYTDPILEILAVDSSSGNDTPFALVMAVIAYKPSGEDRQESFEFYIKIHNAVVQDDDLPPDEVEGPEEWLTARAVRFDVAQSLSSAEQLQARTNIGASTATEINAASGKTTPVDADTVPLIDSEASNVLKKVTWANIKATLKTYLDTLYTAVGILPNAAPAAGRIPVGNAGGTAYAPVAVSGDATLASTGALTIANDAVGNTKAANMAQNTIKGRVTASTGDPEDLSAAQVVSIVRTSLPVELQIACSDVDSDITSGTSKVTFRMPFAMTLTEVRASVSTAPTGSTIIIDINEDTGGGATSILSTKLTIDAGEDTSESAATPAVISDASLADDAKITIDFDQVGSSTPGKQLMVTLIGTRA